MGNPNCDIRVLPGQLGPAALFICSSAGQLVFEPVSIQVLSARFASYVPHFSFFYGDE